VLVLSVVPQLVVVAVLLLLLLMLHFCCRDIDLVGKFAQDVPERELLEVTAYGRLDWAGKEYRHVR
jgi:hypothetical protein